MIRAGVISAVTVVDSIRVDWRQLDGWLVGRRYLSAESLALVLVDEDEHAFEQEEVRTPTSLKSPFEQEEGVTPLQTT